MVSHYDVIIVGAGIAGSALAHALSQCRPKSSPPLRIALLERSLAKPDRIVGELLQPGGMRALSDLGLTWCTEGIDAVPVYGYCVVYEGKQVEIPYPTTIDASSGKRKKAEGRSFHHGEFIMQLRKAAIQARGVDVLEATVTELIECSQTGRVIGIRANRKSSQVAGEAASSSASSTTVSEEFYAELIVAADGAYSKFRTSLSASPPRAPSAKSHFFGAILKHAPLPLKHHGTVALIPGCGPVLMYQIDSTETRMLADVRLPLPQDTKGFLMEEMVRGLPGPLQPCVREALEKDRLRSMPNQFLPAAMQGQHGSKEGVILLGDAWNMRHPLTGGGMTVALNDVVILSRLLSPFLQEETPSLSTSSSISIDWRELSDTLQSWHWARKGLSSTINILSVALYDLFGADDVNLHILRDGCFAYFERGGECVNGPVSLLSGLAPSPTLLAKHFFSVAFYAIYVLFTRPRLVKLKDGEKEKSVFKTPSIVEYPGMILRSFAVIWTAIVVFGPLVWTEIRWW